MPPVPKSRKIKAKAPEVCGSLISFEASLKPSPAKAVKFDSDGASEIVLECPSCEMTKVLPLLTLAGETFIVHIEVTG